MKKPSKTDLKTINGLSELFGADRRTLRRALSGVRPVKRGRLRLYPVSIAMLALSQRRQREQRGPLADLKAEHREKQIELLRLRLARRQSELISRSTVVKMMAELERGVTALLRQKLEVEWPVAAAHLEPAQIRVRGKAMVDDICGELQKVVEPWEKKDGQ